MSKALNTIVKRPRGRPQRVDGMNLMDFDPEEVAEAIKLRFISRPGKWEVHAGPDGAVYLDQPENPRYAMPRPDEWLVGTYSHTIPVQTIEDDLHVRLREILDAAKGAVA